MFIALYLFICAVISKNWIILQWYNEEMKVAISFIGFILVGEIRKDLKNPH